MKKSNIYIAISLLTSLFIYIVYRTEHTIINNFLLRFVQVEVFRDIKFYIEGNIQLSDFFIYSLPGGLWVFCATLLSKDFYLSMNKYKVSCVFFPLIFSVSLELFQLLKITNGTFDLYDILAAVVFWFTATAMFKKERAKINVFKEKGIKSLSFILSYLIVFLSDVWV